jgi:hypothetical protein
MAKWFSETWISPGPPQIYIYDIYVTKLGAAA